MPAPAERLTEQLPICDPTFLGEKARFAHPQRAAPAPGPKALWSKSSICDRNAPYSAQMSKLPLEPTLARVLLALASQLFGPKHRLLAPAPHLHWQVGGAPGFVEPVATGEKITRLPPTCLGASVDVDENCRALERYAAVAVAQEVTPNQAGRVLNLLCIQDHLVL